MYDLIIAGAGTAGCLAAKTGASFGLKVCLLDAKPLSRIGDKVCGDAIGKHHFDKLGLAYPKNEELTGELKGCKVLSPDSQTSFTIEGLGAKAFMVNRYAFGQRLLKEAMDAGALVLERTIALEPIFQDGFIRGVRVLGPNGKREMHGRIIVDATGFQGALRKRLPPKLGIQVKVAQEDLQVAYREIRVLETPLENQDYGLIFLGSKIAPGGYAWLFPKGREIVNVGVGVQAREGYPNPKRQLSLFLEEHKFLKASKVLDAGGGIVPTRRPLLCLVAGGFMIVGDAACQVNPIHGGGIGPSMTGGKMAAEAAVEALEKGEASRENLWSYCLRYLRGYGAKQAVLDVFRHFLQEAKDEELNYGMSHHIIEEEDVLKASLYGEVRLNITEKARRFFKAKGCLGFLLRLRRTTRLMKRAKELYEAFPNPEDYERWLKAENRLFEEVLKL
ncbi:MAG: geranylgeranyl reductase family protein [Candidatus Bathyarchaeia archaeon]